MSAVAEKILAYYRDNRDVYRQKCDLFIAALEEKPIVRRACERAGLDRSMPYVWRANDPEFKRRWDNALENGTDEVEGSLYDMAVSQKNVVATIFYLKNNRHKYREETRIVVSKEDVDQAIEAALVEYQLPGLEAAPGYVENVDQLGQSSSDYIETDQSRLPTPTDTLTSE